jgi:hypothetical protein
MSSNDFVPLQKLIAQEIRQLSLNFKSSPEEWECNSINGFLENLANWIEDCDGLYKNTKMDLPSGESLSFLLNSLKAAKIYE